MPASAPGQTVLVAVLFLAVFACVTEAGNSGKHMAKPVELGPDVTKDQGDQLLAAWAAKAAPAQADGGTRTVMVPITLPECPKESKGAKLEITLTADNKIKYVKLDPLKPVVGTAQITKHCLHGSIKPENGRDDSSPLEMHVVGIEAHPGCLVCGTGALRSSAKTSLMILKRMAVLAGVDRLGLDDQATFMCKAAGGFNMGTGKASLLYVLQKGKSFYERDGYLPKASALANAGVSLREYQELGRELSQMTITQVMEGLNKPGCDTAGTPLHTSGYDPETHRPLLLSVAAFREQVEGLVREWRAAATTDSDRLGDFFGWLFQTHCADNQYQQIADGLFDKMALLPKSDPAPCQYPWALKYKTWYAGHLQETLPITAEL